MVSVAGVPSRAAFPYAFQRATAAAVINLVAPDSGPVLGGSVVLLTGELFTDNATVIFVERSFGGTLTGIRAECRWRGVPGMYCSDTMIRCGVIVARGGVPLYFPFNRPLDTARHTRSSRNSFGLACASVGPLWAGS